MDDLKHKIGVAIRHYRKRAGLSQKDLAQACGVDEQTIYRIEGGAMWPRYENLTAICGKLGIDPAALFSPVEYAPTPQEALDFLARALGATPARAAQAQGPLLGPEAEQAAERVYGALQTFGDDPIKWQLALSAVEGLASAAPALAEAETSKRRRSG